MSMLPSQAARIAFIRASQYREMAWRENRSPDGSGWCDGRKLKLPTRLRDHTVQDAHGRFPVASAYAGIRALTPLYGFKNVQSIGLRAMEEGSCLSRHRAGREASPSRDKRRDWASV